MKLHAQISARTTPNIEAPWHGKRLQMAYGETTIASELSQKSSSEDQDHLL